MLNSRVFSLSVLADKDSVHVVVWSLEASDGYTRTNVGEEIKSSPQGQIQGDMSFSN